MIRFFNKKTNTVNVISELYHFENEECKINHVFLSNKLDEDLLLILLDNYIVSPIIEIKNNEFSDQIFKIFI